MMNWKITEGSYSEQILKYLLSMRLQYLTKSTKTSKSPCREPKAERLEQAARAVFTISLPKMQKPNSSSSRQ
jgi:hypothetical protein